MTQVYIARDQADAERVCTLLRGAGLTAVVQGDPLTTSRTAYPTVWVSTDDAEQAHALLTGEVGPEPTPEGEPV